jgi:hypothetical protein
VVEKSFRFVPVAPASGKTNLFKLWETQLFFRWGMIASGMYFCVFVF